MYNVFDRKTNRYLYNESQFGTLSRARPRDRRAQEHRLPAAETRDALQLERADPRLRPQQRHDLPLRQHRRQVDQPRRVLDRDQPRPDDQRPGQAHGPTARAATATSSTARSRPSTNRPSSPGLLWVGTDDGNVWVTRDDGKNWTKLNDKIAGNPGYWVSRVAASTSDPGTAYVSYTGFRNDDFRPFVYKTTDYGATWTSIAGRTCPTDRSTSSGRTPRTPNLLFAGTDFGVYVSLDGGKAWTKMKTNMPTQPVHDLKIHPREGDLIVATHGRGAYIADIKASAGDHARGPGQGRPSLRGRAQGPLGRPGPPRVQQLRTSPARASRPGCPSTTSSRPSPRAT